MRLIEVEIENYKQYAGTHSFRPGERAMVAIVGANGSGKTTLFEAIEWCLYNPTRIKNDSLIPRLQGGKPRVRVVLEDPRAGIVYEIERSLKGGSTQAEIYRQDRPESPLVQGTRQVTDYVTRELTGLSHTAFVATFFTRQKELSFFGDLGPTARREQVGRLLGLETIRVAQKSIGEQRTRKQAEARVKREQYEEQTRGVDFSAERERLDSVIVEQMSQRDTARTEESTRKVETATASAARNIAQQRYAAHAELRQTLERLLGEQRRYEEMRLTAQRELAAIAGAEVEIGRQQTQAANEPALRESLERHEVEKKKLETSNRLAADLQQLLVERQKIEIFVSPGSRIAESSDSSTIVGATVLIAAFEKEIGKLAQIDLEALRFRWDVSKSLTSLDENRRKILAKLETMETLAADLLERVHALTQNGTPTERRAAVQRERESLQQGATAATSVATQTELRAKQLRTLEQNLRTRDIDELCPTCARPFQPGEATTTLDVLAEQVRLLERDISAERGNAERLNQQAAQLLTTESALTQEAAEYQRFIDRLENGRGMIEEQQREMAAIELELVLRLTEAQRHELPTQAEIELLEEDLRHAEAECSRRPRLEVGRDQLVASIQRQESIEQQVSALGAIAYDLHTHNRDYADWAVARDAVARIEELRKHVARRPEREASATLAIAQLSELAGAQQGVERDISALAFLPVEVENANLRMTEALDRERSSTNAAHIAEQQLTKAQREREDLKRLEARLQALASESAAADMAAGELQRVYSEFARFEKFVAIAVTPVLGNLASELLEKVTEGKYDRLEFTEDYGIEVYDGDEDRFPLSQYSGGERDVIALCARLALSQVIGGQATTPIQFMVLDEVFGSLDLDRRQNLMEMLQRLMEENQAFQQLFVISHVDDVRAGAMFDEVWRVSETSEGVSQLEQVSLTGALEDY